MDSLVSNYLTVYFVFDQVEFLLYVTSYRIHERIKQISDKRNVQNMAFKGPWGEGGGIMVLILEELTLLQCIK